MDAPRMAPSSSNVSSRYLPKRDELSFITEKAHNSKYEEVSEAKYGLYEIRTHKDHMCSASEMKDV